MMPACLTTFYPQSKHIRFSTELPTEPIVNDRATPMTPRTSPPFPPSMPSVTAERGLKRY